MYFFIFLTVSCVVRFLSILSLSVFIIVASNRTIRHFFFHSSASHFVETVDGFPSLGLSLDSITKHVF